MPTYLAATWAAKRLVGVGGCIRLHPQKKVAQSSKRKAVELNFLAQLKRQSGGNTEQSKQYKAKRGKK